MFLSDTHGENILSIHLPCFHASFWLSQILVYLFYLCPSLCPSYRKEI